MKTGLSTQLGQQLHLTPQLLQSIRLLQLDGLQLELEVRRALDLNPLLEVEETHDAAGRAGLAPLPTSGMRGSQRGQRGKPRSTCGQVRRRSPGGFLPAAFPSAPSAAP